MSLISGPLVAAANPGFTACARSWAGAVQRCRGTPDPPQARKQGARGTHTWEGMGSVMGTVKARRCSPSLTIFLVRIQGSAVAGQKEEIYTGDYNKKDVHNKRRKRGLPGNCMEVASHQRHSCQALGGKHAVPLLMCRACCTFSHPPTHPSGRCVRCPSPPPTPASAAPCHARCAHSDTASRVSFNLVAVCGPQLPPSAAGDGEECKRHRCPHLSLHLNAAWMVSWIRSTVRVIG